MTKSKPPTVTLSVKLPALLWRQLVKARADGDIPSIQAAVVEGCEGLLNYIQSPKGKKGRKT